MTQKAQKFLKTTLRVENLKKTTFLSTCEVDFKFWPRGKLALGSFFQKSCFWIGFEQKSSQKRDFWENEPGVNLTQKAQKLLKTTSRVENLKKTTFYQPMRSIFNFGPESNWLWAHFPKIVFLDRI